MFFKSRPAIASSVASSEQARGLISGIGSVIEALPPPRAKKSAKKSAKKQDDDLDYEWEFDTPFGKLEFEVEPKDIHEEKERKRREKAEADARKKAARIAKIAAREAEKRGIVGPVVIVKRNNLVPALAIFTIVVLVAGVAIWLFARPAEDEDEIPAELRKDGAYLAAVEPEPSGPFGRLKHAIRAGRKASRAAQQEQQQRFEQMTKQG